MADEKIEVTIVTPNRSKDVTIGVNGIVHKYPVNKPTSVFPAEKEALQNAGYQVVDVDNTPAGEEGSAPAGVSGENRTEPHQEPGGQNDGEPVTNGPDVNPADGAAHPLDHDGDGNPGGSKPYDPPALTGKTTAQLEEIAADEGVTFGDDVKTNADRIDAIEKARAAKA